VRKREIEIESEREREGEREALQNDTIEKEMKVRLIHLEIVYQYINNLKIYLKTISHFFFF